MAKKDKGVKSESEEKSSSFLREIFGMALMLFAVLALVCLLTGSLLFYSLGSAVQGFLLGVFGVYSFFALFDLAHLGLRLILRRPIFKGKALKIYSAIRIAVVFLFAILHLAISANLSLSLGEQISSAYNNGLEGYATTSVFGVIGVLFIAPVITVASVFGAYLLYSIIILLCLVYLLLKPVLALFGKGASKTPSKSSPRINFEDSTSDVEPSANVDRPERSYGFFFNEEGGFVKKSKKELNSGNKNGNYIFDGDFEKKSEERSEIKPPKRKPFTPIEYTDEGKIDLRKRKDSVGDLGQNYPRQASVSKVIPRDPIFVEGDDERDSALNERVYAVPMSEERQNSAKPNYTVDSREEPISSGAKVNVPSEKEKDDKKPPFKVVVSPFGEDPKPKSVGYYDDVTDDPSFNESKPSYEENEGRTTLKDLPEFGGDMQVHQTEVQNFEKTESKLFESVYDDQNAKGKGGLFESSTDEEYNRNTRFKDEFYDNDDQTSSSFDEEDIETDDAPAAKTNVPRPRETYRETYVERARPTASQQTSMFGKPQPKFTAPEDDDSESIENMPANYGYTPPPITLLNDYKQDEQEAWEEHNRQKWCAEMIVKVIKNKKNIDVRVENIITGPSVTRYDISIPEDVSPSDVFSTRQDLSFRLETGGELRMYNIPYTSLIGIEVANKRSRTVGLKETLLSESYQKAIAKKGLHFIFGEDLLGQTISMNVNAMPHLLVCGTTGSGKSVCLNTMLVSLLYRYSPAEFRLIIIDPKKVEFKNFKGIPHLVFNEILGLDNRAIAVLEWAVAEMDRRYEFLADLGYKDIFEYNRAIDGTGEKKLPSILILIDEFAELVMAQAQNKKKIEQYIGRLAQKARSAGISLICATQRASVNVITGSIKANIASRICFKTSSPIDSRVIIDEQGADKLLGNGDALYKTTEDSVLRRGQGAFISNDEIKKVVAFIIEHNKCYYDKELLKALNAAANEEDEEQSGQKAAVKGGSARPDEVDEDYKKALRFAITRQVVSGSSLRTVLKIGYNKSAAIIMWMEKMGYISPILENRMRKVIFTKEDYENTYGPFEDDDF